MNAIRKKRTEKYVSNRLTYFIFDGSFIKIGSSNSLEGAVKRMKSCQTGNPNELSLICVTDKEESELHDRFSSSRRHGEWFSVTSEILSFISSRNTMMVYSKKHRQKTIWFAEYV